MAEAKNLNQKRTEVKVKLDSIEFEVSHLTK